MSSYGLDITSGDSRAMTRIGIVVVLDFVLTLFLFRNHAPDLLVAFGGTVLFVMCAAVLPAILGILDASARVSEKSAAGKVGWRLASVVVVLAGQVAVLWLRGAGLHDVAPERLLLQAPPVDPASFAAMILGLAFSAYSFLEGWQTVGHDPEWAKCKADREAAVARYEDEFAVQLAGRVEEARALFDDFEGLRREHRHYDRRLRPLESSFEDIVHTTDAVFEEERERVRLRLGAHLGMFHPGVDGADIGADRQRTIQLTTALKEFRRNTQDRLRYARALHVSREDFDDVTELAEAEIEMAIERLRSLRQDFSQ